MPRLVLISLIASVSIWYVLQAQENYDIVILNGRVMDPETDFDAVRNVGIRDGRIVKITEEPLTGQTVVDATAMVVAPGFIDTHFHGLPDVLADRIALRDGVTSAMDLEHGASRIEDWYAMHEGKARLNYGAAIGHQALRMLLYDAEELQQQDEIDLTKPLIVTDMLPMMNITASDGVMGWSVTRSTLEKTNKLTEFLDEGLRQGAIGIGSGLGYMSQGVTTYEMLQVQRAAANYGRLTAVHGRFYPSSVMPTEHPTGFNEVFTNATLLGAPLLYMHNVDYGWFEIEQKLHLARARGENMWSEAYPFIAGGTVLGAEYMAPEIYEGGGDTFGQGGVEGGVYDPINDSFYNKEEFVAERAKEPGKAVFVYFGAREPWVAEWIATPHMTLASDGGPSLNPVTADTTYSEYVGHPRTAATRGKAFRIARENDIPLMNIIANAAYFPAKHLGDTGLVSMQQRGRMQEGMIADIVIFDHETITDNATYKQGEQGLPTTGISHVIVSGQFAVRDSKVTDVFAGQPIRFPVETEGRHTPVSENEWDKNFPKPR